MKLYLTIPAVKPNDLSKTLKHVTGYSDADWAGDPTTRKSTSCTLCYVDQFLLTIECWGQGIVALSSGESELYALGALSAELIFAQAILKEQTSLTLHDETTMCDQVQHSFFREQ